MPVTTTTAGPGSNRVTVMVVGTGLILLSALLLIGDLLPPQALWARWLAISTLTWWLPGALLVALWRLPELNLPTGGIVALGLGLCWLILLTLLLHWLPGPITLPLSVGIFALGALLLLIPLWWRAPLKLNPTALSTWGWLAALLLTALVLRVPGLGYHEFHYDEVLVLTRAREAIRGEDDAFARHTKGPGELAVATPFFRALGTVDESVARSPFAVTSVASILALALLGRRLFSRNAGLWAGLLLALNGFALGLSRIAQYQAVVLLLMILSLLAAWIFARRGEARWLALAVTLSAFGLVMHYEYVLAAPALLLLTWYGWRHNEEKQSVLKTLLVSGVGGLLLIGAAYIPTYLNPFFSRTQNYLGGRMGAPGSTFNLPFFVEMGTFYNSIYFFTGIILLAIIGMIMGFRHWRRQTITLVAWFAPFLIVYLFVIQFPGTHFYLLMPSWSLLAALPLAVLIGQTRSRPILAWAALVGVAIWLLISVNYLRLAFFQQEPEYVVNYAEERIPFYWAPYGENIPEKPRFGLPILEGWKTLGVLSEWGYLRGTYASNERSRHLRWYLGDFDRVAFEEDPEFIFVASHLQEPDPGYDDEILKDYNQVGEIQVRGEARVAIWSREALPVPYVTYDAEAFAPLYAGVGPALEEWPDPISMETEIGLGPAITLLEAGVNKEALAAGDTLHIYLRWRPEEPLPTDYKLFVHITGVDGVPLAQWDGLPGLNTARTSEWQPDTAFADHVLLQLPDEMPGGNYQIIVGLYDPLSGERVGGVAPVIAELTVRD
jgi:hypothetical protein